MAGALTETSWIAEWFPHTPIFMLLWSPSVYNLLHLFVIHLPSAHLSLPYIQHVKKTKRAGTLSKQRRHVDFILFFASSWRFGVWSERLGKRAERKEKCSYICSQMWVEKMFLTTGVCMEHWRWHAVSAVLLELQRCLKLFFFPFFHKWVGAYLPLGLLTKAAACSAHID